jgi:hypothetical protein
MCTGNAMKRDDIEMIRAPAGGLGNRAPQLSKERPTRRCVWERQRALGVPSCGFCQGGRFAND